MTFDKITAACLELADDHEFALRIQGNADAANLLLAFFSKRGISLADAQVLALAYMAGTGHATIAFRRALDRAQR